MDVSNEDWKFPWWARFGRRGADGYTDAERGHLSRLYNLPTRQMLDEWFARGGGESHQRVTEQNVRNELRLNIHYNGDSAALAARVAFLRREAIGRRHGL